MLRTATSPEGYKLHAVDGIIGSVDDVLFDDQKWVVRYLVAHTGIGLVNKKILISPLVITRVDPEMQVIEVSLTKEQIRNSPDIDSDMPVSRQHELEFSSYYRWPQYWAGDGLWGSTDIPNLVSMGYAAEAARVEEQFSQVTPEGYEKNPHLRSINELIGYHIHANDGEFGHVDDLVFEEETWAIRYVVIDTKNWLPGKAVLVAPEWISRISWADRMIYVNLARDIIKSSPEYDPQEGLSHQYEETLQEYYHRLTG